MAAVAAGTVDPTSACLTSAINFVGCLDDAVINPILLLIFAAGLLVFIWGLVEYMWGLSTEAKNKEEGKQHMLWGLVGMFIMVASYAILKLLVNTIGPSSTIHLQ